MRYVFMRYPDGKAKAATFSYDDGGPNDKRLAKLLAKYGIKGTFNLNCARLKEMNNKKSLTKEEINEYFVYGHEVAVHGELHRANGSLRPIEGIRDVLNCRLELEKVTGRIIRGMAYPDTGITIMGVNTSYAEIKQYLKELGIVYARTLGGDNNQFMLPSDFYAWMPTAHQINPKLSEYVDEFIALDLSTKTYKAKRNPRLLYIWGHAHEFMVEEDWERIEQIFRKISDADDIWLATNIEIYDYVTAYRSLIYSADGYTVYNPTLIKLFMDIDGKLYSIAPGETLKIEENN